MRTVEISVGLFIIISVIAFVVLAMQVSGLSNLYEDKTGYIVRAEFTNIGGLKTRGKVVMAGVSIGRVISVALDPDSYDAIVTMRIDNKINTIPDDTRASILTAGLLGDNFIGLAPGFSDEYLMEGSLIPIENTDEALMLEKLISKFVTSQGLSDE